MSQIYIPQVDSLPSIPTQFTTDSGNAIPAGNNLNVLGGLTSTDSVNGINTIANPPNSSNLFIELTNTLVASGIALGNSTTNLITFPLNGVASSYRFTFEVIGRTATNETVGYTVFSTIFSTGIVASQIQTPFIDADESAGAVTCSIGISTSGNNVLLIFTSGIAASFNYRVLGKYIVV